LIFLTYDGEALLYYLSKTQNKTIDYKKLILRNQQDVELFDQLYAAIVEGEEHNIIKSKFVQDASTKEGTLADRKRDAALSAEKMAAVTSEYCLLFYDVILIDFLRHF
jgi:hypothetical protein